MYTDKFDKEYSELYENASLASNNFGANLRSAENGGGLGVGSSGMNLSPQAVSFLDLLSQINKDRTNNSQILGYPLQHNMVETLSEIVGKIADVAAIFKYAQQSDLIKNNIKAKKATNIISKKLHKCGSIMMSLSQDLDDLAVDSDK